MVDSVDIQRSDLEKKIMERAAASVDNILKKAEDLAMHHLENVRNNEEAALSMSIDEQREKEKAKLLEGKAGAELEAKLSILKTKDRLINEVFAKMWRKLDDLLKDKEYSNVLRNLIIEGVLGLGFVKVTISAGEIEKKLMTDKFLSDVRIYLSNEHKNDVKFSISSRVLDNPGGIILSNEKGTIEYDNSWKSRFERMRGDLYFNVADILFKEGV